MVPCPIYSFPCHQGQKMLFVQIVFVFILNKNSKGCGCFCGFNVTLDMTCLPALLHNIPYPLIFANKNYLETTYLIGDSLV